MHYHFEADKTTNDSTYSKIGLCVGKELAMYSKTTIPNIQQQTKRYGV